MAKMFYSIDEAAKRLGKSAEEVQKMASSGQLQEFKDRDKLMFKREQVDLLAGDAGGNDDLIPLMDSGADKAGSSLTLALDDEPGGSAAPAGGSRTGGKGGSGSSMGIEADEPGHRSGISIFDTEETDSTDPLAATAITQTGRRGAPGAGGEGDAELTAMESGGSGSGLLDLTREADDTSLGADLLEDVYKKESDDDAAGGSGVSEAQGAAGLFETTSAPSDMSASASPAMALVAAEPFDGPWSGITGGIAAGIVVACIVTMFALLNGMLDASESGILSTITGNIWAFVGGFGGLMVVGAIVGFVVGKKS